MSGQPPIGVHLQGPGPVIRQFEAWVWDPRQALRVRGLPTAYLDVCWHELVAYPNAVARFMRLSWDIHYRSPTVVIERLRPFGGAGVLVDLMGQLGRVAVNGGHTILNEAIVAAGFNVIVVDHWGWERPRPVRREELGEHLQEVPPSLVRD